MKLSPNIPVYNFHVLYINPSKQSAKCIKILGHPVHVLLNEPDISLWITSMTISNIEISFEVKEGAVAQW